MRAHTSASAQTPETLANAAKGDPRANPPSERSAYLWNTASSMLMAFQSVIMLMVLTRAVDMATAGVFTLAYANANLFLNLGKYGVRNYQVSDVDGTFGFRPYLCARLVTVAAMLVVGGGALAWSTVTLGYPADKALTIAMMLVFKAIDALEDVFHGNYQQHGHLAVGARVLTARMLTMIACFAGLIVVTRNLLVSLTVTTAFTGCFFACETIWVWRRYGLPTAAPQGGKHFRGAPPDRGRKLLRDTVGLLKECFPVFLALFLLFYIGNAPKYAIDAAMDDAAQAYYGFIAMPVFVVGLLANFIYNPILASLSKDWAEGRVGHFARRFALQCLIIAALTAVCIAGAWLVGVPVLSVLYNADLAPYKLDLVILLVGGGFLALATLFTTGITIIRWQRRLILGYVAVSALAFLACPRAVELAGIDGASWVYLALMAVLTVWFGVIFAVGVLMGARRARE